MTTAEMQTELCITSGACHIGNDWSKSLMETIQRRMPQVLYLIQNPAWTWYEPVPESLLGTKHTRQSLHPTLARGYGSMPADICFSELMLFSDTAGLIVMHINGNEYRWSLWYESNGAAESYPVIVQCEQIYTREGKFNTQFGLDDGELPERLWLKRYLQTGQVLAWTLFEIP